MEEIKTGVFKVRDNIPIFVLGDIHGDYQCLIHCLVDLCNVAEIKAIEFDNEFKEDKREILEWVPNNNSIVIFCGDLIHRKRFPDSVLDDECSDIFIIQTLFRLKKSAQKFNGDIIIISGNHEIMSIIDPDDSTYTSDKNLPFNKKYFSQTSFIDKYIANSYAWIKLNDIMIAHGGLCSDYLKFLDDINELNEKNNLSNKKNIKNMLGGKSNLFENGLNLISNHNIMIGGNLYEFGDDIVKYVNDRYKKFFTTYSTSKSKSDEIGYKLFVEYNFTNKNAHNIFWCREWGYSGINCENFDLTLKKIGCNKMIIAHCPQFLSEDKAKMINFECEEEPNTNTNLIKYKIARVDLGMSRSFEYNKSDDFVKFLSYNYNRKMAVLKLGWDKKNLNYYLNPDCVKTFKISCIQYLLLKYGIEKKDWDKKKIKSNWLGFDYIEQLIDQINNPNNLNICSSQIGSSKLSDMSNMSNPNNVMLCLLYPIYSNKSNLKSVEEFNKLI